MKCKQITVILIFLFCILIKVGVYAEEVAKKTAAIKETEKVSKEVFKNNFAVVWQWQSRDKAAIDQYLPKQFNQLMELVKKEIVENVYYNPNPIENKFENYPNISFTIRERSIDGAREVLNKMIFVEKSIATYTLYPVGVNWLARNTENRKSPVNSKSFVTVWSTLVQSIPGEILNKQVEMITSLWKNGTIENIYFDTELVENDIADFVFYVNADTETQARDIVHSLPFYKKNIARYNLYPVGVFWLDSSIISDKN